jgi:nitrogen fixation NifU-like protein
MPTYSEKVMEHFMNPRNVGEIPDADGVGTVGNPVCGDMMAFYIKVDDEGHLADVKFKTFGCGAAIAVSSMVSEMAKGLTLEEAKKLTNRDVANELDGLPPNKMHCSNLGADALHKAIEDYESRGRAPREPGEIKSRELEEEERHCFCPYCESAMEETDPTCHVCGAELDFCPECGEALPHGAEECPACTATVVSAEPR